MPKMRQMSPAEMRHMMGDLEGVAWLVELDKLVDDGEDYALYRRWTFGCELLAIRNENGGKQLPDGLLDEIVAETGKSHRELRYRMQFAAHFTTEDEVCKALQTYGSWWGIISQALPANGREPKELTPEEKAAKVEKQAAEILGQVAPTEQAPTEEVFYAPYIPAPGRFKDDLDLLDALGEGLNHVGSCVGQRDLWQRTERDEREQAARRIKELIGVLTTILKEVEECS